MEANKQEETKLGMKELMLVVLPFVFEHMQHLWQYWQVSITVSVLERKGTEKEKRMVVTGTKASIVLKQVHRRPYYYPYHSSTAEAQILPPFRVLTEPAVMSEQEMAIRRKLPRAWDHVVFVCRVEKDMSVLV